MPTAFERALDRFARSVADETVTISEIPAPTFKEGARARYVHERLQAISGWDGLDLDGIGNVVAWRRGEPGKARGMIGAHLDHRLPQRSNPRRSQAGASDRARGR